MTTEKATAKAKTKAAAKAMPFCEFVLFPVSISQLGQ
jgi:hypothetical protein